MSDNSTSLQHKMEESMRRIHNQTFNDWIQNFAFNLENIWKESSAKELESNTIKQKSNSAIVIGRGPSIKKHKHLQLLAESDYRWSIICTDGSLIGALDAGITPEKFPKFYVVTIDPYQIIEKFYKQSVFFLYQLSLTG